MDRTAAELARQLGGELTGDGSTVIQSVDTLEAAGPQSLSWVGSPAYLARAARSGAAAILIPSDCDAPPGKTVIRVPDPNLALCEALRLIGPPPEAVPTGVHPSAIVEEGAEVDKTAAVGPHVRIGPAATIGPGTQLHAGVYIGRDTTVGRDCILWPNVVVRERVTIGERVIIHPNATIGADGFGYLQRDGRHVKIPQVGTVIIEDDVEIGANTTIDRARSGVTRIGRGTKIDNLVIVAHNCQIGEGSILVAQSGIGGSSTVGKQVMLGGQTGIIDHRHLGDGCHLAAKSAVFNDFPAGTVLRGVPAVENQQFLREQVAVHKLPALLKQIKALEKRVAELESRR